MEQGMINYSDPKMMQTLKDTVAVGATDAELAMFSGLCEATGLNPFKKEVWFIKTKGYTKKDGTVVPPRVQIMTGINGFLAIANKHPMFDGLECEVKRDKDGYITSAIAKVYRKDRKYPSVFEALWNEYYIPNTYGNKGVWETKGSVMIAKCAKSMALREAFPQELNGLYTEEEMPSLYERPKDPAKPAPLQLDEPKGEFCYKMADIDEKKKAYLEKEGAQYDPKRDYWVSPKKLNKKLDEYLDEIIVGGKQVEEEIKEDDDPDGLEQWHKEINARLSNLTPLEKAKARAKEMLATGDKALEEALGENPKF